MPDVLTAEADHAASDLAARTVGEIAARLPGATGVFRRHRLDYCCGGDVALAEAAARRGAALATILADLAALTAAPAAQPQETGALIELIVARYHDTHRRELPELIGLARRVEAVHGGSPDAPAGLAALLAGMESELLHHMVKEEYILFPLMRRGGHPMIAGPIDMVRHEHDGHAMALAELERITGGHEPPEDACNSWRALYAGTRKLAEDLVAHMHLENNVLFPRFEA